MTLSMLSVLDTAALYYGDPGEWQRRFLGPHTLQQSTTDEPQKPKEALIRGNGEGSLSTPEQERKRTARNCWRGQWSFHRPLGRSKTELVSPH